MNRGNQFDLTAGTGLSQDGFQLCSDGMNTSSPSVRDLFQAVAVREVGRDFRFSTRQAIGSGKYINGWGYRIGGFKEYQDARILREA